MYLPFAGGANGIHQPELNYLLTLVSDIYKKRTFPDTETINLNALLRLAWNNKLEYYLIAKIVEDRSILKEHKDFQLINELKKLAEEQLLKLCRTLKAVNEILGDRYVLIKTYKGYPRITYDVDLVVEDIKAAIRLFKLAGFRHRFAYEKYKMSVSRKGFLEIELHETGPSWGSIAGFLDDELLWSGDRRVIIEGVEVRLPPPESDILTLFAHINYQLYEIQLGELLYIYQLSSQADWKLMAKQAHRYGWSAPFYSTISIINSLHLILYEEPSPIEEYFPFRTKLILKLPYVIPLTKVIEAITSKGAINLIKLPSYLCLRVRDINPSLYNACVRIMLSYLGNLFIKYVYF